MSPKVIIKSGLFRAAGYFKPGKSSAGALAPEHLAYLTRKNPALVDLKQRYERAPKPEHSAWTHWENSIELRRFRGENDYLSQAYFRQTGFRYSLTAAYTEMVDQWKLLDTLTEDDRFGVKTWDVLPGKVITRDLLDSILEIYFLREALSLERNSNLRVLDIGAGYGRLAHRVTNAFPQAHVTCTDAVATSTFLSEFYLRYRNAAERTRVVPFDKLNELQAGKYDLAVNVHSWTECTRAFVAFWLDRVVDLGIKNLFVVPHFGDFATTERDGTMGTYEPELKRHGFKQVRHQPKCHLSKIVQTSCINPADYRFFQR